MQTGPRLLFSSLTLLFAIETSAQAPASRFPTRDATAAALLTKSLGAMSGGLPITDVALQGTAHRIAGSDDESGPAVLRATSGGNARIDANLPSGTRTEIRSASADGPAGVWSGPDAVKHPIAQHNLWTDSSWFFPAFVLARVIGSPSYSFSYVGRETRDGQTVEHVMVFLQATSTKPRSAALISHLSQMDIFLDSASLLPIAVSFNVHPDDDAGLDIPVEVRFSAYRSVNGGMVPFRIQKYMNNGLVLDLHFETAALNTGFSSTTFNLQ